jgi:hypothetical protein
MYYYTVYTYYELYEGEKSAKPAETCKESADTKYVPVTGKFYRSVSVKKVIVCTQTYVRVFAVEQANQNTSEALLSLSLLFKLKCVV